MGEKMRIAYFSTEFPPLVYGGLGVYVDNITRQLIDLDQKIAVFTWGNGKLPRHEIASGVEVFRETPVPMRDGMEIFLSQQSRSWGEGLNFMMDPSATISSLPQTSCWKAPSIWPWLMIGWDLSAAWL